MTDKDIATLAMINVSKGVATEDEKYLVETLDERLFSEIYKELQASVMDSQYSIEEYYEVDEDKKQQWDLDEDEDEEETKEEKIKSEFTVFYSEFGEDYESEEVAYNDFIENYCSVTTDNNYSSTDSFSEMEDLIVDEFSEFLVSNGYNYSSSEEAYDDYIRNYCNYI